MELTSNTRGCELLREHFAEARARAREHGLVQRCAAAPQLRSHNTPLRQQLRGSFIKSNHDVVSHVITIITSHAIVIRIT